MTARDVTLVLALLGCAAPVVASAQPLYPSLRLIAPAAPGGGWDQTARAMQQALQGAGIATTVSVENVAGAAGTIGLARFISAEAGRADVLLVSGLIMLGGIVTHRPPVTLGEVTPIARLTGEYEVIVVPVASPYRTLHDLIDAFRARPESIAWGGGSAGGTDQILAGLVAEAVGVSPRRVNYIAFSGGGESMSAILGGQVAVGINGLAEFAPHIAAGSVRVLAVSSEARLATLDAPTLREQGVDVVLENWRSLVGPPRMRPADRDRLTAAVARMVQSPEWRETLRRFRWNDRYLDAEAFARFQEDEERRVAAILEQLGTGAPLTRGSVGWYPLFVLTGLAVLLLGSIAGAARGVRTSPPSDATVGRWRAAALAGLGIVLDVILIERGGFVLASGLLFWLTARAFDTTRPLRDAIAAVALSLGVYLVFARFLQIPLPPGIFSLGG